MQICIVEEGNTWMTPYRRYLADGVLPLELAEAKKIKRNSAKYTFIDGKLFRHGFTHPILVCVSGDQCTRIMAELHEGICGSHVGGQSLASKVFASVEHPQTNRQVEYANRVLLRVLKRRLEKAKGTWAEEVHRIVWAYHTTPQSTTRETPFSLVYGSEAIILVEIQESSPRFQNFVAEESNEERKVNLDLLDEVREDARIKAEGLKRRVEYKHSSKIRPQ
ncbi:uncharacterized protein [Phaseolus vulgaris]|uniref:uncharacterized protein n=1 Tax=Phaseolus vulgaris TaxID=3885 RepID=UPI0035CC0A3F